MDGASAAYQHAIQQAPERIDVYQQATVFLARHGRATKALNLLDPAIRKAPDNPELQLMKAAMLGAVPRPDEAEKLLQQIEARWPEWGPLT